MKICVLCGGRSNERDVSISSGTMIARSLRKSGHDVVLLDVCEGIELNGHTPEELYSLCIPIPDCKIPDSAPDVSKYFTRSEGFFGKNVIEICKAADIVFNALHGDEGENGMLQAMFDLLGIRYTGSGMQGCLLAMNKSLSKQLFIENDIPTPEHIVITCKDDIKTASLRFPCVVKPGSLGSSVGVSIVHDESELEVALNSALSYESLVIIEKYIHGREFSVGVLGGKALPAIEIVPKTGFYDYKNKYQAGCTEEICPAELDEQTASKLAQAAVKVCNTLGLGAYARIDFMVDESGFYCLEANTLPGMTPTSLLPQEANAMGIDFPMLLETIINESMKIR